MQMIDVRKMLGSLACFLTLSGEANIDLSTQSAQYIDCKRIDIGQQQYIKLCENIQKSNLFYFIVYNDENLDKQTIQGFMPILKKTLKVSKKRMQKGGVEDEKVYYSTLALLSFFESKEIVGGIEISKDFDIVEYGKGVEEARDALRGINA
ncbi:MULTISPECIES: hypothetical protein [Helicobacter]|uniref:hypothetical protein n=1 Tax=Helicobacter TaxID=209 RepID=UPI0026068096|nr:hypothetical protein [Helicobacter sp. UBA3407]